MQPDTAHTQTPLALTNAADGEPAPGFSPDDGPHPAAALPGGPECLALPTGQENIYDPGDSDGPLASGLPLAKSMSVGSRSARSQVPRSGEEGDEPLLRRLRQSLAGANRGMTLVLASGLDFVVARDGMAHGRWLPWIGVQAPRLGGSERSLRRHVALADGLLAHLAQIGHAWPISDPERLARVLRTPSPRRLDAEERTILDVVRAAIAGCESRAALQTTFRSLPRLTPSPSDAGAGAPGAGLDDADRTGDGHPQPAAPPSSDDAPPGPTQAPDAAIVEEALPSVAPAETAASAPSAPAMLWDLERWRAEARAALPLSDSVGVTSASWRTLEVGVLAELIGCLELTLEAMRARHRQLRPDPAAGDQDQGTPLFAGF